MLAAVLLAAVAIDVRPTTTPIRVDAKLEERAWAEATPVPIAYEWYPSDNTPAPVRTEALVTYDDRNLYVAFRAHDPEPSRIRARYHEPDAATEDDLVGFYIDPFNDDRRAYQFRINPLGVQIDAINSDVEDTEDFTWDGIWESAGALTADGYVVEVAVPLQQLRIPSGSEAHTWGFLAIREWPRDVAHRLRSVQTDQNRDCLVCQFQDLRGFATRSTGRNLEVTPTLTGTSEDAFDPGVSTRWSMTPGTSLQATVNPDFSQVEADAAQLDVNTRFALYFPEKRPFFVEAADFFETRLPLVFTRTVADPSAGLKLTGKSGAHLFGGLVTRDEITNLLIPGDQSSADVSLDRPSTSAFARYRGEAGGSATVGGLLTARRGDDYENTVLAADGYYRATERDSLRLQVSGSRTAYPDAVADAREQPRGAFEGHAIRATYNHTDRDWTWLTDYQELAPDFRADSGFVSQVGVRYGRAEIERRLRGGPDRWFRNIFLSVGVDGTREFEGLWNEWGADIGATYQGPRQTEISFNLAPNQEFFRGRTYHNFRHSISAQTQASRDVIVGLGVNMGEAIDFTNRQPADFVTLTPYAIVNVGRRVRAEVDYAYQMFDTTAGERIFAVHLPQARVLVHFNRRTFVRGVVQYETVDFADESTSHLLTQLLFSYRVNAQTLFLTGYSEQTGEEGTVFAKVSYAWLF